MNPGAYLKSHLGLVLSLLGTLALLTFVMEVAGGRSFALLGLIIGSAGLVCGLSLDYLAHRASSTTRALSPRSPRPPALLRVTLPTRPSPRPTSLRATRWPWPVAR